MLKDVAVAAPSPLKPSLSGTDAADPYVRLHIAPFDPELLDIVLPASVRAKARRISYHTVETFPEKRFGFVELPAMEAEKIKKKLNGNLLKGSKMRVEKARPHRLPEPAAEDQDEVERGGKERKKKQSGDATGMPKKRKRDAEVVEGVQLRDRKVKRGWTVPEEAKIREKKSKVRKDKTEKHKKREVKSRYTDKEECLLKTKLPSTGTSAPSDDGESRRKKKSRETVVHEFEKTTKFPTFLKSSQVSKDIPSTTEYVDGKGWVDGDGNVIESVRSAKRAAASDPARPVPVETLSQQERVNTDGDSASDTSSSGTSSDDEDSSEDDLNASEDSEAAKATLSLDTADTIPPSPATAQKTEPARPQSSSSHVSLTIKIPPPITPSAGKVHPLEALYKRPKADASSPSHAPADAPFSFFDAEDPVAASQPPMTPFTQQDFEWRNIRSAAPTPDTAHPNRTKPFWAIGTDDDKVEDIEEEADDEERGMDDAMNHGEDDTPAKVRGSGSDAPAMTAEKDAPESEFQKWFWENRRDLNRSWMKRRKTAAKEKRYRENKARASKAT